eukprot:1884761-Amphidinium_carterae.1
MCLCKRLKAQQRCSGNSIKPTAEHTSQRMLQTLYNAGPVCQNAAALAAPQKKKLLCVFKL